MSEEGFIMVNGRPVTLEEAEQARGSMAGVVLDAVLEKYDPSKHVLVKVMGFALVPKGQADGGMLTPPDSPPGVMVPIFDTVQTDG